MEVLVTYADTGTWTGDLDEFLAEQDLSEFVTRRIRGLHESERIRLDMGAETFTIERTA